MVKMYIDGPHQLNKNEIKRKIAIGKVGVFARL